MIPRVKKKLFLLFYWFFNVIPQKSFKIILVMLSIHLSHPPLHSRALEPLFALCTKLKVWLSAVRFCYPTFSSLAYSKTSPFEVRVFGEKYHAIIFRPSRRWIPKTLDGRIMSTAKTDKREMLNGSWKWPVEKVYVSLQLLTDISTKIEPGTSRQEDIKSKERGWCGLGVVRTWNVWKAPQYPKVQVEGTLA